jgi:hypothetical protein
MSDRNEPQDAAVPTTDTEDLLHEVIEGAEKIAHDVADSSIDALETAALIAMEASSQLQNTYKQRPLLMLGVLGAAAAALLIGIAALARRS